MYILDNMSFLLFFSVDCLKTYFSFMKIKLQVVHIFYTYQPAVLLIG